MARKDFPLPADLARIPLLGDLLGSFIGLGDLFIAGDAGPSYFKHRLHAAERRLPLSSGAGTAGIGPSSEASLGSGETPCEMMPFQTVSHASRGRMGGFQAHG